MEYCKKCGAYIPIDETKCPACGYDPAEEARQAQQAAAAAAQQAQAEAEREKQEAESFAAQEKKREEEARRRAQEQRAREQRKTGQSGPYQTQYTSQRTGQSGAAQGQSASERTGWTPPWSQSSESSRTGSYDYERMRARAQESVQNQRLSVLSYLGPLLVIPMVLRNKDDFARYHSNQGLALLLATGVGNMAAAILGSGFLGAAVEIFGIYCTVKGIMNVVNGKKEPLPLIGGIKLFK